jgi:signal transduction histidine kinase
MFYASDPACTDIEIFLSAVLNSLHEHVAVIEKDGTIIAVNEAWRKFAADNDAKSPDTVSEGVNYIDVCKRISDEDKAFAREALNGIQSVLNGKQRAFSMEYPCSSPTEQRWFLMNVVPLRRPEGGAVITHANITRRILAEQKMREIEQDLRESREEYRNMTRKLISAREDARRRLARELHDSFSQRLALISMLAARLEIEKKDRQAVETGVKRIQEDISNLSADIHDIAKQLHPQILEDLGLSDAIASFCSSFSAKEGIPVDFETCELLNSISLDTSLNIYRIVQESLANATKHAKANRIKVSIETHQGMLILRIRDDGIGFDPELVRKKSRLGLVSLRERAAIIGGELSISSAPGSGTEITVEVPMRNSNSDSECPDRRRE